MADNLQNYMRMANIFSPQQQQQTPIGQINFGQPSTQDIFSPQQQQPQEITTLPSRTFPQILPEPAPQTGAWDEFLNSVMNPPQRTHMTYPDSTLNVYNKALELAAKPSAYDNNRVYVDGKAYQKQKAFTDPNTGQQRFLSTVNKPGFFDNTLEAMAAGGTAGTDILNQPYKDAMDDWKLKSEGLRITSVAQAQEALARQREAQAGYIGQRPGLEQQRIDISRMTAEERARVSQLNTLTDAEKIQMLQQGRITLAELQAAEAMKRVVTQQAGATERTNITQAGANRRMDQSQAGADRRNAATIAGANQRNAATIAGANQRNQNTIAARRTGGVSESQSKIAQQRVANELIDEMPELEQHITYDQNGFPLISDDLDPADRQFILDEFSRRLGTPSQSVVGNMPTPPAAPTPRVGAPPAPPAPPATTPQPAQKPAAKPATPASGKVRVVAPDGRTGTWDYSKGPIPNGYKLAGK